MSEIEIKTKINENEIDYNSDKFIRKFCLLHSFIRVYDWCCKVSKPLEFGLFAEEHICEELLYNVEGKQQTNAFR